MARSSRARSNAHPARSPAAQIALPAASVGKRVLWVVAAGAWGFALLSMLSFDTADWPSHVVAVHRDPPFNFGGRAGAVLAYQFHLMFGVSSWLLIAGVGGALGVIAAGRPLGHTLIRTIGLLLATTALSGLHALCMPNWSGFGLIQIVGALVGGNGTSPGSMTGVAPGLLGMAATSELIARFSDVMVFAILMTALLVGGLTSADKLVLALPGLFVRGCRRLAKIGSGLSALNPAPVMAWVAERFARPHAMPATGLGDDTAVDLDDLHDPDHGPGHADDGGPIVRGRPIARTAAPGAARTGRGRGIATLGADQMPMPTEFEELERAVIGTDDSAPIAPFAECPGGSKLSRRDSGTRSARAAGAPESQSPIDDDATDLDSDADVAADVAAASDVLTANPARASDRASGRGKAAAGAAASAAAAARATEDAEREDRAAAQAAATAKAEPVANQRLSNEELRAKIARLPVRMTGANKPTATELDAPRQNADGVSQGGNFEGYRFPTLDLLDESESNYSEKMEAFVRAQAQVLEETLQTFSIDAEVTGIESGPVVTLFSVQLAPGTRVARLQTISSDIARSLQAQNIRILPNTAGKTTVGIEVPNLQKEKVRLKELMTGGYADGMALPMFLGKDASGEPLVADLTRMPHMLIAGTTGSGKSVCMNTIIMSWLFTKRPDELKLVLVDPKMVEMSQFADIPHLMSPVVTEMSRAAAILEWAVDRMEERYELLMEAGVRDIASYNGLGEEELYLRFEPTNDLERAKIPKKLPYMVFVIDELADLMMTNKEVEHSIVRIAQKARAVGIHLILATQRPQANVVTGLIKSNMPCRASFKVASGMDSRIVLDSKGAELLLGQGDMLFLNPKTSELRRAQGTLVTDGEIRKAVRFLKDVAGPSFERSLMVLRSPTSGSNGEGGDGDGGLDASERDPLFDKAVEVMIESGRGSVSLLQRRLAIGYSRASRLVDQMGLAGILGEHKGSVAREVMITLEDWHRMRDLEEQVEKEGTVFEDSETDSEVRG